MFYTKFTALCKEVNKSPVAIAKELGLSNAAPTHWKNGKVPGGETLIMIGDYFDVSIDWLLDRTEDRRSHKNKVYKGKIQKTIQIHTTNDGIPYVNFTDLLNKNNDSGIAACYISSDNITDPMQNNFSEDVIY